MSKMSKIKKIEKITKHTLTNLKELILPPQKPFIISSNKKNIIKNLKSDIKPKTPKQTRLKMSTRQGYGDGLLKVGKQKNVVVLCADLTNSTNTASFEKAYPKRFFQCGVAEQNMVSMAVGLALSKKIPYVSTFAAFIPNRALDQVRVGACYNNLPIKFCSTHAGLTLGEDGATHQAMEDIASMRSLPNMKVIVPCDYDEAKKATVAIYKEKGPVYLRLGRSKLPRITSEHSKFEVGKANLLRPGNDITIIACGVMVSQAMRAAEILSLKGIDAEIINLHTNKPIDENAIITSAKKTGLVVTAEEHQIYGGLGSAVSEVLSKNHPVPMDFVAVKDTFGESGKPDELLRKYDVDYQSIIAAAEKLLKKSS